MLLLEIKKTTLFFSISSFLHNKDSSLRVCGSHQVRSLVCVLLTFCFIFLFSSEWKGLQWGGYGLSFWEFREGEIRRRVLNPPNFGWKFPHAGVFCGYAGKRTSVGDGSVWKGGGKSWAAAGDCTLLSAEDEGGETLKTLRESFAGISVSVDVLHPPLLFQRRGNSWNGKQKPFLKDTYTHTQVCKHTDRRHTCARAQADTHTPSQTDRQKQSWTDRHTHTHTFFISSPGTRSGCLYSYPSKKAVEVVRRSALSVSLLHRSSVSGEGPRYLVVGGRRVGHHVLPSVALPLGGVCEKMGPLKYVGGNIKPLTNVYQKLPPPSRVSGLTSLFSATTASPHRVDAELGGEMRWPSGSNNPSKPPPSRATPSPPSLHYDGRKKGDALPVGGDSRLSYLHEAAPLWEGGGSSGGYQRVHIREAAHALQPTTKPPSRPSGFPPKGVNYGMCPEVEGVSRRKLGNQMVEKNESPRKQEGSQRPRHKMLYTARVLDLSNREYAILYVPRLKREFLLHIKNICQLENLSHLSDILSVDQIILVELIPSQASIPFLRTDEANRRIFEMKPLSEVRVVSLYPQKAYPKVGMDVKARVDRVENNYVFCFIPNLTANGFLHVSSVGVEKVESRSVEGDTEGRGGSSEEKSEGDVTFKFAGGNCIQGFKELFPVGKIIDATILNIPGTHHSNCNIGVAKNSTFYQNLVAEHSDCFIQRRSSSFNNRQRHTSTDNTHAQKHTGDRYSMKTAVRGEHTHASPRVKANSSKSAVSVGEPPHASSSTARYDTRKQTSVALSEKVRGSSGAHHSTHSKATRDGVSGNSVWVDSSKEKKGYSSLLGELGESKEYLGDDVSSLGRSLESSEEQNCDWPLEDGKDTQTDSVESSLFAKRGSLPSPRSTHRNSRRTPLKGGSRGGNFYGGGAALIFSEEDDTLEAPKKKKRVMRLKSSPCEKKNLGVSQKKKPQKIIDIPFGASISIKELSDKLDISAFSLQRKLLTKFGVHLQTFDAPLTRKMAVQLCEELEFAVSSAEALEMDHEMMALYLEEEEADLRTRQESLQKQKLRRRPPVVTVIGHVDHGKTTLLDAIKHTNEAEKEYGGITQKLAAYQISVRTPKKQQQPHSSTSSSPPPTPPPSPSVAPLSPQNKEKQPSLDAESLNNTHIEDDEKITFIDTPGHAAFHQMRKRGVKITDLAVLVVAADAGVQEQTVECVEMCRELKIPFIVAVNKMDVEEANCMEVFSQLAKLKVLVEDLGGEIQCVRISAKKRENIDELLEKLLLESEMLDLMTDEGCPAEGYILESHFSKALGIGVTAILTKGVLRVGEAVVSSHAYGKVRLIMSSKAKNLSTSAVPSQPIQIFNFEKGAFPMPGDTLRVVESEKTAKVISEVQRLRDTTSSYIKESEDVFSKNLHDFEESTSVSKNKNPPKIETPWARAGGNAKIRVPIVIKADSLGSAEVMASSLKKTIEEATKQYVYAEEEEVKPAEGTRFDVVSFSAGVLSKTDLVCAAPDRGCGIVVAYNTKIPAEIQREINSNFKESLQLVKGSLLQECVDAVKRLVCEDERFLSNEWPGLKFLGKAEVMSVFDVSKKRKVAGSKVINGVLRVKAKARVIRGNFTIHEGMISSLRHKTENRDEVLSGEECGIGFFEDGFNDFKIGDVIKAFG